MSVPLPVPGPDEQQIRAAGSYLTVCELYLLMLHVDLPYIVTRSWAGVTIWGQPAEVNCTRSRGFTL